MKFETFVVITIVLFWLTPSLTASLSCEEGEYKSNNVCTRCPRGAYCPPELGRDEMVFEFICGGWCYETSFRLQRQDWTIGGVQTFYQSERNDGARNSFSRFTSNPLLSGGYTLEGKDSYGDGWNGASLSMYLASDPTNLLVANWSAPTVTKDMWYSYKTSYGNTWSVSFVDQPPGQASEEVIPCPSGRWGDIAGKSVMGEACPHFCSPGKYSSSSNKVTAYSTTESAACNTCPTGRFATTNSAYDNKDAALPPDQQTSIDAYCPMTTSSCYVGYYCEANRSVGTLCPAGRTSGTTAGHTTLSSGCPLCSRGHFCPGAGQSYPCPKGRYGYERGNVNVSDCRMCDPGTHSSSDGAVFCENCQAGTYCPGTGEKHNCPAGRYGSNPAGLFTDIDSACQKCDKGKYADGEGSTVCQKCNPFEYANGTGSASCKRCPPNHGTGFEGATDKADCIVFKNGEDTHYYLSMTHVGCTPPSEEECDTARARLGFKLPGYKIRHRNYPYGCTTAGYNSWHHSNYPCKATNKCICKAAMPKMYRLANTTSRCNFPLSKRWCTTLQNSLAWPVNRSCYEMQTSRAYNYYTSTSTSHNHLIVVASRDGCKEARREFENEGLYRDLQYYDAAPRMCSFRDSSAPRFQFGTYTRRQSACSFYTRCVLKNTKVCSRERVSRLFPNGCFFHPKFGFTYNDGPGTDCGSDGVPCVCLNPCPAGTYSMYGTGAFPCQNCPMGRFGTNEGAVGPEMGCSGICPVGRIGQRLPHQNADSVENGCSKLCPVGTEMIPFEDPMFDGGGQTEDVCTKCPKGTFSAQRLVDTEIRNDIITSLRRITVMKCIPCDRGRYAADTAGEECEPCPLHYFQDDVGGTECKACPVGKLSPPDGSRTECTLCVYAEEANMEVKIQGLERVCVPCGFLRHRPSTSITCVIDPGSLLIFLVGMLALLSVLVYSAFLAFKVRALKSINSRFKAEMAEIAKTYDKVFYDDDNAAAEDNEKAGIISLRNLNQISHQQVELTPVRTIQHTTSAPAVAHRATDNALASESYKKARVTWELLEREMVKTTESPVLIKIFEEMKILVKEQSRTGYTIRKQELLTLASRKRTILKQNVATVWDDRVAKSFGELLDAFRK